MSISELDAGPRLVYVVDDDGQVRDSLKFLMTTCGIEVQGFDSGSAFLKALNSLAAAPIILDIRMPGMDGIELLEELASRAIHWPVIVLSGHGEIGVAVRAIKSGAIDFLEKPVEAIELETCLLKAFHVLEDERVSLHSRSTSLQLLSLLTPRESEVLGGLCSGKANKQVAFALSISPRTVEMHRAHALRRLGVRTIAEVVTLMNATKAH